MKKERTEETHPSYAQLLFHRIEGGEQTLYGSKLRHNRVIRMTLARSKCVRDLNETSYYAKEPIVEVDMSEHQFAELITTLNIGSGVPVTVRYMGRERVEDCPDKDERELFTEEFKEDIEGVIKEADKLMKRANEILSQKSIKVSERNELRSIISGIQREVKHNLPFVNSMFQESMDKAVTSGKLEMESYWNSVVTKLGQKALTENATPPPTLIEQKPEDEE